MNKTAMTVATACDVLGVTFSDAWAEVKSAYRRCARDFHPDAKGGAETTASFQRVQLAYDVLCERQDLFGKVSPAASEEPKYPAEKVRVDGIVVTIHYGTWGGATLDVNIDDALSLKWFPEPSHGANLYQVRILQEEEPVLTCYVGGGISVFRATVRQWQDRQVRLTAAQQFKDRLLNLEALYYEMKQEGRSVAKLNDALIVGRSIAMRLGGRYDQYTVKDAEVQFAKIDAELERIRHGGADPLIDDLLDGILYHSSHNRNARVIETVASWSIRTGGFIEPITEPMLRAYYAKRIPDDTKVDALPYIDLHLHLEDYFLEDLVAELDDVAPDFVTLTARKGEVRYAVTYDEIDQDGDLIPVAIVSIPLATYEKSAGMFNRPSQFPELPHGIVWFLEIFENESFITRGFNDVNLERKVKKYKRAKARSTSLASLSVDEYGFRRRAPIDATPIPPWYKGSRVRW